MFDLLIERQRLTGQFHYLAVNADSAEALMGKVGEKLGELAFAARNNRSHDDRL